jgi:hypothetical protein
MHKTPEIILGKPFSTKGKTQQPLCYISKRRTSLSIENIGANKGGPQDKTLAHNRVFYDQEGWHLEKSMHFNPPISDHALSE